MFSLVDLDHLITGGGSQSSSGSSVTPQLPPPDPKLTSGHAQHRKTIEMQFKTRVAKDSLALLLEPGVKVCLFLSVFSFNYKLCILSYIFFLSN